MWSLPSMNSLSSEEEKINKQGLGIRKNLWGLLLQLIQFAGTETEVLRGKKTCPRSQDRLSEIQDKKLRFLTSSLKEYI